MRIAHVMGRFAANGTERQLASTLEAAAERELWEPTVVVLRPGHKFAREVEARGIPVIELRSGNDWDPRRAVDLRRVLRFGGFDVVHSSLWGANAFTRLALMGSRLPVVISERRVEDYRPRSQRFVDQLLRAGTDGYIGNSEAVGGFIARAHRAPPSAITIITNGLDTDVFYPVPREVRNGAAVVGSVGRLIPLKGFDVLLAAVPSVCSRVEAEFRIVGEGGELERLKTSADGLPVTFLGKRDRAAEVGAFLRSLDLFVLPSRAEGLPNAVLEAVACGLPVVATEAPGVAEALPGITLVPPDSPGRLAEAIVAALADPDAARPRVVVGQSFEDAARRHLAVFERALQMRRHRRRSDG